MNDEVRSGLSLWVCVLALVGCGGATTPPGADTAAGDAAAGDAEVETLEETADVEPEVCAPLLLRGPTMVTLTNGGELMAVTAAVGLDARVLVAWEDRDREQDTHRIQRVLLDATGATVAAAAPVDTDPSGSKDQPVACALSGGGYVIAWSANTEVVSPDGASRQIHLRRFDADGVALDPEAVRVLTEVPGAHAYAEVACGSGGGFVVAGVRASVANGNDVFFQRFDADGVKSGDAVTVNPIIKGYQQVRAVAVDAVGAVIVTWDESLEAGGSKDSTWRRFPAEGEPSAPHVYATPGYGISLATDPSGTALALSGTVGATSQLHWLAGPDAEPTSIWLGAPDRTLQMVLAPIGCGRFAALWYAGTGPSARTFVGSFGRDGFDAELNLGTGLDVPIYRPALAYGHGVLAAVWPQTTSPYHYALQVALIGTASE